MNFVNLIEINKLSENLNKIGPIWHLHIFELRNFFSPHYFLILKEAVKI